MNTESADHPQIILNEEDQERIYYQDLNSYDHFQQLSADYQPVEQYASVNKSQEQFNQFRTQQMKSKTKNTPKTFGCKFNKFLTSYQKNNKGCPNEIKKFIKKKNNKSQLSYGLQDFNLLLQGQTPELAEQYLTQGLYIDLLQSNRIASPQDLINSIEYYALQFKDGKLQINRPHVKNYTIKPKKNKDSS